MPKLKKEDQFFDLSDYGRSAAISLAISFRNTNLKPVHVTFISLISGLLGVFCVLYNFYFAAGLFLIAKSVLDAADGELSRVKNIPSYTGRYIDSISDFILNFLIILAIGYAAETQFLYILLAFAAIQLQGTLYNYYYVILRNNSNGGDKTSHIFERRVPKALSGESQKSVSVTFKIYKAMYGLFDKIIYYIDRDAHLERNFPGWFMTLISLYGLGFQLLIISLMLFMNLVEYVIPFFIYYSVLMIFIVAIRKYFLSNTQLRNYPSKRKNSYSDLSH